MRGKTLVFTFIIGISLAFPAAAQNAMKYGGGDKPSVTIDLTAKNIAFHAPNLKNWNNTLTVPPGTTVIVNFVNRDSGVPHNFSVYQSSAAKKAIFKGRIIRGPDKITYTFVSPDKPGTYFFRCDVHPAIMNGAFIVKK